MAETVTRTVATLDDVILMAAERPVSAGVELATRQVVESVRPDLGETREVESYLLSAEFYFRAGHETYRILKIYLQGYRGESLEISAANRRLANFRLQRDYRRLRAAGIEVEERYFEEFRL